MDSEANFLLAHNARHLWHPMAHPADMQANPPKVLVAGEGVEVTDVHGHRVLDAVGGLWNVNLGYSCDPVKQAITEQLARLPYYSAFRGTSTGSAIELSHALAEFFAPEQMTRAFFTSGGSDSVETALRLARQYHKIRGERDRTKFVSVKRGYHGTHFGGASVNGNINFRRNYEPLLPGCLHITCPHTYRNPFAEQDPERLGELCAGELADEIEFQGPDTVAAFIMEPVLGAGGVIPPPPNFMPLVRDICRRHGVLLIADEVITAFGRTGAWTGSRLWDVQPDLMCLAKAITNGYFPFGAVMVSAAVAATFEECPDAFGNIGHGYTYSAHPVGAAAGMAALAETKRLAVHENAAQRGTELLDGCRQLYDQHDIIGDVRGCGLMVCLELVMDRETQQPATKEVVAGIYEAMYAAGVLVRTSGHNLILSPPLVISAGDVMRILDALAEALATGR